jgi:trimethylamine--corrinoid protein Co-methyltransferase
VLKDLIEGVVLCDALPNIDFVMSMIVATDITSSIADRYHMETMLTYSTKPIIFVTYGIEGCKDAVEMAEVVAGSADALRTKPFIACYINAVSGLRHNKEALEKLMFLAEENLPSLYIPSSTAALNSPVTPAGAVALDNAGVLLGLVISQLVREGAPVIIPGMPQGTFDMQTLVTSYGEPERILPQAMAHFYGVPMFAVGGASDAKLEDQQAAAETAMSLVVETFMGGDIIHDLGYIESGITFSFIQLALCDEIVSWIKAYTKEIEVSEETLALDVIAEIGPDGVYLNTDHTLRHYKERWYPTLFERATYHAWFEKGGKSFSKRAQEKIDELLQGHRPEPLPVKIKGEFRRIISKTTRS